jgi:TM2 domain-containing membrane protein YozV
MIENVMGLLSFLALIGLVIFVWLCVYDTIKNCIVRKKMEKVLEAMVKKAKEDGALPEDEAEAKEDNE